MSHVTRARDSAAQLDLYRARERVRNYCALLPVKSFRTKSDSWSAFICANPAKCRVCASAVNALIGAQFRQNRARTRNAVIGFESR